jgi:hypothetical protein
MADKQPQVDWGTAQPIQSTQVDWGSAQPIGGQSYAAIPPEPTMLQKAMTGIKDLGIGALKGAGSTMSMADDWARQHLPAAMTNTGMGFGKPEDIPAVHAMMQPQGTAQSIGKGVEQAAEFMIPGGAEEKLLGKAPLLARMAGSAVGAGAVNKAQGGSFGAGAAMGAGGQALGSAMRSVAPSIAEGALGIPKAARAFGKTPGRAILDETSGIRPETVAKSAKDAMGNLTPALEQAAAASTTPASLAPARQVVDDSISKATGQNAGGLVKQLQPQADFLARRFDTGQAIPQNVSPSELLNLKRGFSEDHLRWSPELHDRTVSTGRQAYGALDRELDRTVPEAAGLNQRISSLIPVAQRAESVGRDAPTLQRAFGRFGAHTGALTGAGIGGAAGYHEGGIPGAIAGGLTGVLAPELIASPEGQMAVARSLNMARGLKPAVGAAAQLKKAMQ